MPTDPATATIPDLFFTSVERRPDTPALGVIVEGQLDWLTWRELEQQVVAWASALRARGVTPGSHVVQLAGNSLPWVLVDLALHWLGAVHVPLHAALSPAQAAEQIKHARSILAIVDPNVPAADSLACDPVVPCVSHDRLTQEAAEASPEDRPPRAPVTADQLATILYTSGTTGQPLGVMLTHGNLASNALAVCDAVQPPEDETRLSILPLSHIYGRTCDMYCWLARGTRLALAESRETIFRDCQLVRPNALNAVPYFYRKVVHRLQEDNAEVDEQLLRHALGGEIKRCYCGGAALAPEIDAFYRQRGLPICCGYGLTETAPVISASSLHNDRSGAVGPPIPGMDVRLADDGEILVRGAGVMQGYWQNQEATESVFRDGWLATGDLGAWDGEHLVILGRKKELIVLATGKNVAPTAIEGRLAGSNLIEQVCVVGDRRDYLTALVVPNPIALRREIRARRLWVWSKRRALSHPKVRELYRQEIVRLLGDLSSYEQVGEFVLLDRAFSAEQGELTPKMSLRRPVLQEHFADQIEAMYGRSPRATRHTREASTA